VEWAAIRPIKGLDGFGTTERERGQKGLPTPGSEVEKF